MSKSIKLALVCMALGYVFAMATLVSRMALVVWEVCR